MKSKLCVSIAAFSLTFLSAATNLAEEISFPWGCPSPTATPIAPAYQVLPPPAHHAPQAPIQTLPAKPGYAYGWFGSTPHPQWGRHFGFSQNFTQWSRRAP
jgi:hypothetical protein